MTTTSSNELHCLRQKVQALEQENRLLKGISLPAAGSVKLQAENATLRREVEHLRSERPAPRMPGDNEGWLGVDEIASRLDKTRLDVLGEMNRGALPYQADAAGNYAIRSTDLDRYLQRTAEGKDARCFL